MHMLKVLVTATMQAAGARRTYCSKLLVTMAILVLAACAVRTGAEPALAVHVTDAQPAMANTPALASSEELNSAAPEPNHLYLATLSGERVLFVTNAALQRVYDTSGVQTSDPYVGLAIGESGNGVQPVDFRELDRPLSIYASQREVTSVQFRFDAARRLVYASLGYPGRNRAHAYLNQVIAVDLDDLSSRLLWTHEDGDQRYPGFDGGAVVDEVVGHIAVLRLFNCYACEPFPPHAIILLNTTTGGELYLGVVGDVQIDVESTMVTYRNLGQSQVPCEPSPGCDNDGYRVLYEPVGDALEARLP